MMPFIAHHLALGARELFLFIDGNAMPASLRLPDDSRLHVTLCNDRHWRVTCGSRPGHIGARQLANAAVARALASADWLLHCDTDEFLVADESVFDTLSRLPGDTFSVLLEPWEAVYEREPRCTAEALASSLLRRPIPSIGADACAKLYGTFAPMTLHGLAGHVAGKSIVRRQMPIGSDSVHRPLPADPGLKALASAEAMRIAHFHAPTFARWLAKWGGDPELQPGHSLRRRREHIRASVNLVHDRLAHGDLDTARTAFRSLYVFDDPARLAYAQEIGLVIRRPGLFSHAPS
jgi:hypothetical protein